VTQQVSDPISSISPPGVPERRHPARPEPWDPMVQLVTPDGERRDHPLYAPLVADIGPEQLRRLYSDLVVVRRIDQEATALQRQGELGLWAPLLGQEAAQVGSARALAGDDYAFVSYRENGVAWCRGADLSTLLRQMRGAAPSSWAPSELNTSALQIIIGAHALHAVGYAMGQRMDGASGATISYFGDGATSQGDVSEAFVFAASYHLPVVFFVSNNQWAISEPVERQSRTPLYRRGEGFGVPGVQVDGNDVLAVLAATRQALTEARAGGGPRLIEAVTYRMGPHTTSDDPRRYRDQGELDRWAARDPLERVRRLLVSEGALDDEQAAAVRAEADRVAAVLRRSCIETPPPPPEQLFEHVYAAPHPRIEEQRAELLAHLDAGDDETGGAR
jgi:2-oxoisovalerate dehydrogenase E1 component alpha subunit